MKPKIIHLIHSLQSGGTENVLLRMLPLISDFDHVILTLSNKGDLIPEFKTKGIKVISVNQRCFFDVFSYYRILRLISQEKPTLIITHLFYSDFVGRILIQSFFKCKLIPYLQTTYNFKRYWPARIFERLTKNFVQEYFANSNAVKNFYSKNFSINPDKIKVIPNGIELKEIIFADKNSYEKRLGIKVDDIVFICVANLSINKGHRYLLEAFEKEYSKRKNIKLLIVGDGEEKSNLAEQIRDYTSNSKIIFLGKRRDVKKLLLLSDMFILPTFFEGLSNAIMEAMSVGLPVITTDIEENRELITDKINGMLCKLKDSDSIAEKIEELVVNKSLASEIGKNARELILKNYEINKIADKWNQQIKLLIKDYE